MKMVFLSFLHGFGGAEKQIIMLANEMTNKGHDVTLISLNSNNMCYYLNPKVNYIFIPDNNLGVFKILGRYIELRKYLKKLKPDIIINFWFQTAYLTAFMSRTITGKIIYSERGDPGDKEYSGILGFIRSITLPRIDGFVFQSYGAMKFFDSNVQKKSIIIHNPVYVDKEECLICNQREKTIVTIGRLHAQKNQQLLINAFAQIADQFPSYKLEIYGDGELRDELQNQILSLKMEERIFLLGTSKNVLNLIKNASLFVLSSDYEGLPNTLIEAMSLGIPCISTDCRPGGAREIINDGENGIITKCGDCGELSSAIKFILSNPEKGLQFSKEGKKIVEKFNPIKIYEKWEKWIILVKEK